MTKIKLAAIAAMAQNRVIGKDNDLIWHISEDLKHFKRTTLGKPIIMGRKSYEALGKPLPGRANIVISRSGNISPDTASTTAEKLGGRPEETTTPTGLHHVKSIEAGIELAQKIATEQNLNEIFITGGGEIYKQILDRLDRLYITILHRDYEGDTYFPEFNWDDWIITKEEKFEDDPDFTIYTLDRK